MGIKQFAIPKNLQNISQERKFWNDMIVISLSLLASDYPINSHELWFLTHLFVALKHMRWKY